MTKMTNPNATALQQEELELEEMMWHTLAPKTCLYEQLDDVPSPGKSDADHRQAA